MDVELVPIDVIASIGRLRPKKKSAAPEMPCYGDWAIYHLSKEVGNVKTSELRMTFTMMKGGGSCNNTSCINTSQKNKQQ